MSETDERCGWCGRVEFRELAERGRHRCGASDRQAIAGLAFWVADDAHHRAVEVAAAAHATGSEHHAREAQRAQTWASWLMRATRRIAAEKQ